MQTIYKLWLSFVYNALGINHIYKYIDVRLNTNKEEIQSKMNLFLRQVTENHDEMLAKTREEREQNRLNYQLNLRKTMALEKIAKIGD